MAPWPVIWYSALLEELIGLGVFALVSIMLATFVFCRAKPDSVWPYYVYVICLLSWGAQLTQSSIITTTLNTLAGTFLGYMIWFWQGAYRHSCFKFLAGAYVWAFIPSLGFTLIVVGLPSVILLYSSMEPPAPRSMTFFYAFMITQIILSNAVMWISGWRNWNLIGWGYQNSVPSYPE